MSWRKVRIGDICTIEKGATGILKAIPGQYPLVTTGEERKTHNEFQFDAEAVIIPLVSGTGHGHASIKRIHYQTGKFALGSILCAIIPNDQNILNAEYLYRFLVLNKDRELVSRMRGMANVTLPLKEIANVEIPLPTLKQQIEFVKKYKHLENQSTDLCIELANQQDIVKQMRKALLTEAMQGKLTKQEPSDDHARALLEKIIAEKAKSRKKDKPLPPIKDDEIPFEIPKNWVWCRLGEVCNYGSSPKSEPNKLTNDTWVLDLEDIEKDSSKLLCKIRFAERNSLSTKSRFVKGQVLYSKLRPYLDKVMVADEDGVCTTEILPLNLFGKINAYYIRYALKRGDFLSYVNSVTRGMKMPRLGTKEGQLALMPLAPLPEQERIVQKLDELMRYCDALEKSIAESQANTDMLLQQVLGESLSGEAIVKHDVRPNILPQERVAIDFKLTDDELRDLLGGYILTKADLQKDFGHLKLIKHMVTVEYGAETPMPTHYIQFPNGPYDKQFMEGIGYRLEKKEWFKEMKKGSTYTYKPLAKAGEIEDLFNHFFAEKKEQIDFLIGLMNKAKPKQAEIIATVYAVWNDLLINQMDASIDKIKLYFFKWSEKKKAFKPEQVEACYNWMNKVGLIPKGTGRIIMRLA